MFANHTDTFITACSAVNLGSGVAQIQSTLCSSPAPNLSSLQWLKFGTPNVWPKVWHWGKHWVPPKCLKHWAQL